jgi:hypothetical protein
MLQHQGFLPAPTHQGQVCPPGLAAIAAELSALVASTMEDFGIKHVYNADKTGYAVLLLAFILPSLRILHNF